jgi:hypothetical protein
LDQFRAHDHAAQAGLSFANVGEGYHDEGRIAIIMP